MEKHISGLPRRDEDNIRVKRLDIGSIDINDSQRVVGDREEELVVERGVDQPEQVPLAGLHLQLECVCVPTMFNELEAA